MSPKGVVTLERGNVYFFFRPEAQESPEKLEAIQRMSVVLSPEESPCYRLLVVGRRRFPEQGGEEKTRGFVDTVSNEPKKIENRLAPEAYPAKTGGESHVPALRPMGEGVYSIVRHDDHTHFVYALELPKVSGGAQAPFHLENQASYIINILSPEKSAFPRAMEQPIDLPGILREKFCDRDFSEADPPDLLNYVGMQFVLIPAAGGVRANSIEEVGSYLQPEEESLTNAGIFDDLKRRESARPSNPLFKGQPR